MSQRGKQGKGGKRGGKQRKQRTGRHKNNPPTSPKYDPNDPTFSPSNPPYNPPQNFMEDREFAFVGSPPRSPLPSPPVSRKREREDGVDVQSAEPTE